MGEEAEALEAQADGYEGCTHACRRCGVMDLRWNDGPPWRLVDACGALHVCKRRKPTDATGERS